MQPTAEQIAANPADYADSPEMFHFAWAELKAARGHTYRPENLPGPLHRAVDEVPVMQRATAPLMQRCLQRIHTHAKLRGYRTIRDLGA